MSRNRERHVHWVDSTALLDDQSSPSTDSAILPEQHILPCTPLACGDATQGQDWLPPFLAPISLPEAQLLAPMAYGAAEGGRYAAPSANALPSPIIKVSRCPDSLPPLLLAVQPAFLVPSAGVNPYELTPTAAGPGANYRSPSAAAVISPARGVPPAGDIDPSPAAAAPSADLLTNFTLLWDVRRTSLDAALLDRPAFPDDAKTCILHFVPDVRGRAPADEFAFTAAVERVDAARGQGQGHGRLRLRVRDVLAAVEAKLLEGRGAGYLFDDHPLFADASRAREVRRACGRASRPDTACWARMDVWPGAGLLFRGLSAVGEAEGGVRVYAVRLESQRIL